MIVHELDEWGRAVWRHKYSKTLFVERPYNWCDRVVVIDEVDGRRCCVDDATFTGFNFADWIPITQDEYRKVKMYYKEIYE